MIIRCEFAYKHDIIRFMVKDLIKTKHGDIRLPAFMPDATYGSIKSISFNDAINAGVKEIVTTTLHIEQKIGSEFIKEFGGIHKFFGWDRPILTDSGGWQVFSLINRGKASKKNSISELGCTFEDPVTKKVSILTPESSQVIQNNLGSDIVTVLDDPIIGNDTYAKRKESVRINTIWAKRSKEKFLELNQISDLSQVSLVDTADRPLLGAVIQGGNDFELRKQSSEELLEIDFDIFNFGGIPLHTGETWLTNPSKGFYHDMLEYVAGLIPDNKLKYAMGVGQPDDIAFCVDKGWDIFDTVLPTRNARHGFLYVSAENGEEVRSYKNLSYGIMHIKSERYKNDDKPIDSNCTCEACTHYSRAYVRHLVRINEPSGLRLATMHNLKFYSDWMEKIRSDLLNVN